MPQGSALGLVLYLTYTFDFLDIVFADAPAAAILGVNKDDNMAHSKLQNMLFTTKFIAVLE